MALKDLIDKSIKNMEAGSVQGSRDECKAG